MKYFTQPPLGTQLDRTHPLNRGLVGYWPLSEGAGDRANDISGTGNNGVLTNGPVITGGKFGSSVSFDGVNDSIIVPNHNSIDFGANQDFTIAVWVNTTKAMVNAQYPCIISKDNTGATRTGYNIYLHSSMSDARWHFQVLIPTQYTVYGRSDIADGKWHFVVGVRSGSTVLTYEDGSFANSLAASSASLQKDIPLHFGSFSGGAASGFYTGNESEVRIYNRALSAQEIQQLYTDPFCMYEQSNKFKWWIASGAYIKSVSGTLSVAGSISKQAGKTLAGVLASTGDAIKLTVRALAGTLTSSGAVAAIRLFVRAVSGTLSVAGSISKQTGKTIAGLLASAGAASKKTFRAIAGVVSFSGALSTLGAAVAASIARIWAILFDNRTMSIEAENRTLTIRAESRTLNIEA